MKSRRTKNNPKSLQNTSGYFNRLFFISSLFLSSVSIDAAEKSKAKKPVEEEYKIKLTKQEKTDRAVDVAAVASRETAIANLKRLLNLKRGTAQEPILLWRLSDIEWRATRNHFRVSVAAGNKSAANVRYKQLLGAVVNHTTELMQKFPKFRDSDEALYRRGQAYQELEKKENALVDYQSYIEKYPNGSQVVTSRLLAAEIFASKKQYAEVVKILQPVDLSQSHDGLVSQVVERQAISNYFLENFPEAIRKAEWLLNYARRADVDKTKATAVEDTLGMIALFYGTAYERKYSGYSLEHAFSYFRKLDRGQVAGKLSHEFIIVLRSKDLQADVVAWKDIHKQSAPNEPATFLVYLDAYDAVIAWKDYKALASMELDFSNYLKINPNILLSASQYPEYKKFKHTLLDFSEKLYATMPKPNPTANEHRVIAEQYLMALSTYMKVSTAEDVMKAKVRFRMGEFYVGLKDWQRAQDAFVEVFQTRDYVVMPAELREQARTRAITARYDYFKEKGILPKDLKASALSTEKKLLLPEVSEWIRWVDEVANQKKNLVNATYDQLLFEANRLVYASGDVSEAYKRMLMYIGTRPKSKLTPATCALVIDTLILSEAWIATRTLSIKFQKMPNVSVGEFKQKLIKLERDSHLKIAQGFFKLKDYRKSVGLGEEHYKLYPTSPHKIAILTLLGKSYLEMKMPEKSLVYLQEVLKIEPNHEVAGITYAVRAQEEEKNLKFKEAFEDLYRVYELPSEKRGIPDSEVPSLQKKLLFLASVSENEIYIKRLKDHPNFCKSAANAELAWECSKIEATTAFYSTESRSAWELVDVADHSTGPIKYVWLAAAFEKGGQLPNSVIKRISEELFSKLETLDPITKMELLVHLNESIPRAFERKIGTVETNAPIEKKFVKFKDSFEKRLKEIQGLETLAGTLIQIPLPEARLKVLTLTGNSYRKIAEEVKQVPVPKDFSAEEATEFKSVITQIVEPLEQKGTQVFVEGENISKQFSLRTSFIKEEDRTVLDVPKETDSVQMNEVELLLSSLSLKAKDSLWTKLIQEGKTRSIVYMTQYSQTPQIDRLGLDELDKIVLQASSLRKLGFEWDSLLYLRNQLQKLKSDSLTAYQWIELYRAVISANLPEIQKWKNQFEKDKTIDRNSAQNAILRVARSVDEKVNKALLEMQKLEIQKRAPSQEGGVKSERK